MLLYYIFACVFVLVALAFCAYFWFVRRAPFGQTPKREYLERIQASPNYKNGVFCNLRPSPMITGGKSRFYVYCKFLLSKKVRPAPLKPLPSVKNNLHNLGLDENVLVWFGHSSYFMQIEGKTFLIDPVFSPTASPFSFATKAFAGTNLYSVDDLPEIDFLFITHDHWDHLSHQTMLQLKGKVKKIICPLGVGAHLMFWGFSENMILEGDWYDSFTLSPGFVTHITPARHFSGRSLGHKNKALWASFVLETPIGRYFFGGDGGYDQHFKDISSIYGEFDLVMLENGQYNESWQYMHMQPEETLQAALDLKAKTLLPVHSAKFVISHHPWDEPLNRILDLAENLSHNYPETSGRKHSLRIITPLIGELVELKNNNQKFSQWWGGLG